MCRYCGTTSYNAGACCSSGSHVLLPVDRCIPDEAKNIFSQFSEVLLHSGREVNQLCSLTATHVEGTGGVRPPFEQAFVQIQGRIYHFPMFDESSRQHPLMGRAQSFVFAEPSARDIPVAERFHSAVIDAATCIRRYLRVRNPLISGLNQIFGCTEEVHIFNLPQHNLLIRDMQVASTAANQLALLFSVGDSIFNRPNTTPTFFNLDQSMNFDIPLTNENYERSTYPLLDPFGTSGWYEKHERGSRMRFVDSNGMTLTLHQYIKYKLQQNTDLFRYSPRVAQEWLLDMTSRNEYRTQKWLTQHWNPNARSERDPIRESLGAYPDQGATRRIASVNQFLRDGKDAGRLWRIPSNIRGSDRYRKEKVQLGMAHVFRLGIPTLFITFTANCNWPEITSRLPPGHKWYHHPELVAEVFQLKLQELIRGLKGGTYFNGRKAQFIQYCIEFQKRGVPHAHILVRLEGDQPVTPNEVDQLSTCSIPLPCAAGCGFCRPCKLRSLVLRHMTHSCYADRCGSPCKYGFPFAVCPESMIGTDGRWLLKRAPHESLIVPYHPELLLRFDAHINVLVAANSRCIYYLRKYMSKRLDCVEAQIQQPCRNLHEELNAFYKARMLTACEAVWMALGYDFNFFWPPLQAVQLNLPGTQTISFDEGDENEDIEEKVTKKTDIEVYFARHQTAESLLFEPFWDAHRRKGPDEVIARSAPTLSFIKNLNYGNVEQFALYCLLRHQTARSFEELRGGHPTFMQAAAAKGVFAGEAGTLLSAIVEDMIHRAVPPDRMLLYFAMILINDPEAFVPLFLNYWEDLVPQNIQNATPNDVLAELRNIVAKEGVDIRDALIDAPDTIKVMLEGIPPVPTTQFFVTPDAPDKPMNEEQSRTLAGILDGIQRGEKLFYVNGLAGTGKTFLLNHLRSRLPAETLCTAYTGVAASLFKGVGLTLHRAFSIPVTDTEEETLRTDSGVTSQALQGRLLKQLKALIVDEIGMVHSHFLTLIDRTLRRLNASTAAFADKVIILSGDFHQGCPIIRSASFTIDTYSQVLNASIRSNELFKRFTTFKLEDSMRFTNPAWVGFLKQVAKGEGEPILGGRIGESRMQLPPTVKTLSAMPKNLSDDLNPLEVPHYLAPHHAEVNAYNTREVRSRASTSISIRMKAFYIFPQLGSARFADVEHLTFAGIPPDELQIYLGMPVMLLRNLFVSQGVCNGSMAEIVDIQTNDIEVRLIDSQACFTLHRINFPMPLGTTKNAIRVQFPIVPAFAVTISKSQGKTLSSYSLDLTQPCFMHGQLYVALSRIQNEQQLTVISPSRMVTNIVYQNLIVGL